MWEHNNINQAEFPCDLAIKKYGKITELEILEEFTDVSNEKIDEREIYWIALYDASNREKGYNLTKGGSVLRGEDSPRAHYTNEEVLMIRRLKAEGMRKIDVYNQYFSERTFRGFEGVWWGRSYPDIGKEYIEQTKNRDWREYSSIINSGENSHCAKLKKEDVLIIRKRYDAGETPGEIHKDYPFVSWITINRVCKRETWKNI
jgi:uncharacterized protein (DUF433 family)